MKKNIAIILLSISALNLNGKGEPRVYKSSKTYTKGHNPVHEAAVEKIAKTTKYDKQAMRNGLAVSQAITDQNEDLVKHMVSKITHKQGRKDSQEAINGALKGSPADRLIVVTNVVEHANL